MRKNQKMEALPFLDCIDTKEWRQYKKYANLKKSKASAPLQINPQKKT